MTDVVYTDYFEYIKDKQMVCDPVNYVNDPNSFEGAVPIFISTQCDIVKQHHTCIIAVRDLIKINDTLYEMPILRYGDTISDLDTSTKNVKLKVLANDMSFIINDIILLSSTHFVMWTLQFLFTEKPDLDDTITFSYNSYFYTDATRRFLIITPNLLTHYHIYIGGRIKTRVEDYLKAINIINNIVQYKHRLVKKFVDKLLDKWFAPDAITGISPYSRWTSQKLIR